MALEDLNLAADHQCSFTVTQVDGSEGGILAMLKRDNPLPEYRVLITPDHLDPNKVHTTIKSWFFHGDHLAQLRNSVLADQLVFSFIALFNNNESDVVTEATFQEVTVYSSEFYECAWNDYLIRSGEVNYFLQLGVSD